MRLFECQCCGQALLFENTACENCGHQLGFVEGLGRLIALDWDGSAFVAAAGTSGHGVPKGAEGGRWKACANASYGVCNWLIDDGSAELYCRPCQHTRTIPNLGEPQNLDLWRRTENAKHRLFYSLYRLGLRAQTRIENPQYGLVFDFLADGQTNEHSVLTGHEDGEITLNIAEADDGERERRRANMGESYRTLLGHFRHEVGHFYWDQLVGLNPGVIEDYRAIFGDEREDYAQALERHYQQGPKANWQNYFVSAYATSHSWEDFAETWAHYLHIVDTLETAHGFGLRIDPQIRYSDMMSASIDFDPYREEDFQRTIAAWLPLTFAVNSLNRSMGQPDLYPFVLSSGVIEKLNFIHRIVVEARHANASVPQVLESAAMAQS